MTTTTTPTSAKKIPPRPVPPRDDKYMGLAFVMAGFSKDPNTQVGAILINNKNRPLGWGYNGPPADINDNDISWGRPEKYDLIIHAEDNAIGHANTSDFSNATLFVTAKPCKHCMLQIVRWGIKEVVYFPYKSLDASSTLSTQIPAESDKTDEIARLGKVNLRPYKGNLNWLRDHLTHLHKLGIFGGTAST